MRKELAARMVPEPAGSNQGNPEVETMRDKWSSEVVRLEGTEVPVLLKEWAAFR